MSDRMEHRTLEELTAGLEHIQSSPPDAGPVELIVRRPSVDSREVIDIGELTVTDGLTGDNWRAKGSSSTPDGGPHPDRQITIVNARLSALISNDPDQRLLVGDQLHVDLDISHENLPAGARLQVGTAVVEITEPPHTGCAKFSERFGSVALRFVNIGVGRELRLRGVNAKVLQDGTVRRGDLVRKLGSDGAASDVRAAPSTAALTAAR